MKFQEPPVGKTGVRSKEIDDELAELKKHPGKWALVRENVNPATAVIYQRRGCEATRRANGYEGQNIDLYVRWPA